MLWRQALGTKSNVSKKWLLKAIKKKSKNPNNTTPHIYKTIISELRELSEAEPYTQWSNITSNFCKLVNDRKTWVCHQTTLPASPVLWPTGTTAGMEPASPGAANEDLTRVLHMPSEQGGEGKRHPISRGGGCRIPDLRHPVWMEFWRTSSSESWHYHVLSTLLSTLQMLSQLILFSKS